MSSKESISNGLSILGSIVEEIRSLTLQEEDIRIVPKKAASKKRNKVKKLDDSFWEQIKLEISNLLVKNYNSVRIFNSPRYQEWKRRARENGLNVKVTDSEKKPVIYIRPALRTGELRERIKNVEVSGSNTREFPRFKVEYEVSVNDLYNNYGVRFRDMILEKTGMDIFVLTEEQLQQILDKILRKLAED